RGRQRRRSGKCSAAEWEPCRTPRSRRGERSPRASAVPIQQEKERRPRSRHQRRHKDPPSEEGASEFWCRVPWVPPPAKRTGTAHRPLTRPDRCASSPHPRGPCSRAWREPAADGPSWLIPLCLGLARQIRFQGGPHVPLRFPMAGIDEPFPAVTALLRSDSSRRCRLNKKPLLVPPRTRSPNGGAAREPACAASPPTARPNPAAP